MINRKYLIIFINTNEITIKFIVQKYRYNNAYSIHNNLLKLKQ